MNAVYWNKTTWGTRHSRNCSFSSRFVPGQFLKVKLAKVLDLSWFLCNNSLFVLSNRLGVRMFCPILHLSLVDFWEKEDLEKGSRFLAGVINLFLLCETSISITCTKLHPLAEFTTVHQRLLSTGHGRPSRNRGAKHMHTFINHRGFLLCKICYCYCWSQIVFYGWLWVVSLIVFSGLMFIWVLWRLGWILGK